MRLNLSIDDIVTISIHNCNKDVINKSVSKLKWKTLSGGHDVATLEVGKVTIDFFEERVK